MEQKLGPRSGHVYRKVREQIESGQLKVGAPLPSQTALSREYGLAVMTVRQAIERLESEGFVSVRTGSGTYVASSAPAGIRTLSALRSIVATSPLPIIPLDQAGNVAGWNAAAEHLFGWLEAEVLNAQLPTIPDYKRDEFRALLEETLEGNAIQGREVLCRRRDGAQLSLSLTAAPLHDADGNPVGIVCTYLDLAERKRVEEALRESEEVFQSAFEFASIGMALVALDGRWLKVNRALCALVGYSEEELLAQTFQDITHPADLDSDLAYLKQTLAGEIRSYEMEKRYVRKDQTLVWVLLTVALVHTAEGSPLYLIAQIQDITQRKEVEGTLRGSENRLRTMVEKAPIGVCVTDAAGIFEQVNEKYAAMLGYTAEDLVGHHYSLVIPPDQLQRLVQLSEQESAAGEGSLHEVEFLRREGGRVTALTTTVSLDADATCRATFALDISDGKQAEVMLEHQAMHDAVTGLANRLLLQDRTRQIVAHAKRHGEVVGLLYLDLDGFKAVNERFGHERGDALLNEAAKRLAASIRASDTIARLAGDEFVIVLPDIGSAAHAAEVANIVLETIHAPFPVDGHAVELVVSIGISAYPFDGETLQVLLQAADEAMHRAKRQGKNTYALYNVEMAD